MSTARKTHVVDSNVILRWLLRDHEAYFEQAARFWNEVREEHCFAHIPEGILVECFFVLTRSYKVPRAEAALQLQRLLSMRAVSMDARPVALAALDLLLQRNLSIADALVIAHARAHDVGIQSFDQDLIRAARS
jgi:predicted nucleic acid-binding protein